MREDLLDAQASIDWAVAHFESFQQRLDAWRDENVDVVIEDPGSHIHHKLVLAALKTELPRFFNVEAGVYINCIRSSLDLLATALVSRHGIVGVAENDTCFPIANSRTELANRRYKGAKLIKSLPAADRDRIESLQPYKGGNGLLWSLHNLDIVRKHRRLLPAALHPDGFQFFMQQSFPGELTFPQTWDVRADKKTIIAYLSKRGTQREIQVTFNITFDEPGSMIGRKPIVAALDDFATLATSITKLFDC